MPEIKRYLSRDGLEEYNSLLPHSSAEMQTYVNDWLDEHPEATTTVQDGAITEHKLADKSVSLRTLADDTVHMLKGAIVTGNLSGEILTAADAYTAPPMAFTVEGKSTQDGTPTPDAPVPIVSVDELALSFAGKNLLPPLDDARWVTGYFTPHQPESGKATITNNSPYGYKCIVIPMKGGLPLVYSLSKVIVTQFAWFDSYPELGSVGIYKGLAGTDINPKVITAEPNDGYLVMQTKYFSAYETGEPQLEYGSTPTAYEPYDATNVLLNLTHALRSLPDGTKDTLALSYLKPSTREGWAWYSRELVQRLSTVTLDGSEVWQKALSSPCRMYTRSNATNSKFDDIAIAGSDYNPNNVAVLCDHFAYGGSYSHPSQQYAVTVGGASNFTTLCFDWRNIATDMTVAEWKTWLVENQIIVQYPLAAPITTTLDPIELPVLPAPNFTICNDQNTGIQLEYVRDSNIVIQNIEQAIADL